MVFVWSEVQMDVGMPLEQVPGLTIPAIYGDL
jgi:hypothetical protein